MKQQLIAFSAGILTALIGAQLFAVLHHDQHIHKDTHPVGYADNSEEVHVHSDFIVFLDGNEYDFTKDEYQTTSQQTVHQHIHLHDNVGNIIHRHDHGITLSEFLGSLGFELTDTCITTPAGATYCSNETQQLLLFVDGEAVDTIADHINLEREQLLLFYGNPTDPVLNELLDSVTDEACIYSGTCPERGIAPPESCGLTCEL